MNPYPKLVKKDKPKPSKIKPRSDKRAKQESEYSEKAKAYLIANPICEVKECNKESIQTHHKKGRIGKLLTDERYFFAVCAECHHKIETSPNWAKANGYSLGRLSKM